MSSGVGFRHGNYVCSGKYTSGRDNVYSFDVVSLQLSEWVLVCRVFGNSTLGLGSTGPGSRGRDWVVEGRSHPFHRQRSVEAVYRTPSVSNREWGRNFVDGTDLQPYPCRWSGPNRRRRWVERPTHPFHQRTSFLYLPPSPTSVRGRRGRVRAPKVGQDGQPTDTV